MSKAKNVSLKPVYTPPSLIVWTDERLAALDKEQLINLLGNLQTQVSSGRVSEATATDLEVRIKIEIAHAEHDTSTQAPAERDPPGGAGCRAAW